MLPTPMSMSAVGSWAWDIAADNCFADATTCSYFNIAPLNGVAGPPLVDFLNGIHADDRARVKTRIDDAVATGEIYSEEFRVQTGVGIARRLRATGRCYRNSEHQPVIFPGHIIDVTHNARSSSAINDIEEHLGLAMMAAAQSDKGFLLYLLRMAFAELKGKALRTPKLQSQLNKSTYDAERLTVVR